MYNDFMCGLSGDSDILGYVDEINRLWMPEWLVNV